MELAKAKKSIIGKWKSVQNANMLLEFKDDKIYTINNGRDKFYSLDMTKFKAIQITAPDIGLSISFILSIDETTMKIANITSPNTETLYVNDGGILSDYDTLIFTRE